MGNYSVTFLQAALDDLEEIVLYVARDSKENAFNLNDQLTQLANSLSDFPLLGPVLPDKKLRKMGFRRIIFGNYMIFYQFIEDKVLIMRVLHGARDYPTLF